jgi:hypothetical protein
VPAVVFVDGLGCDVEGQQHGGGAEKGHGVSGVRVEPGGKLSGEGTGPP